jgi:hypothetical protein
MVKIPFKATLKPQICLFFLFACHIIIKKLNSLEMFYFAKYSININLAIISILIFESVAFAMLSQS